MVILNNYSYEDLRVLEIVDLDLDQKIKVESNRLDYKKEIITIVF